MSTQLLSWLLNFAAAVGKQVAIKAAPVALGIARELTSVAFELIDAELDSELSTEEKAELNHTAVNVAKTAWETAKREGALLESDAAMLVAQAAGSEIKTALGL